MWWNIDASKTLSPKLPRPRTSMQLFVCLPQPHPWKQIRLNWVATAKRGVQPHSDNQKRLWTLAHHYKRHLILLCYHENKVVQSEWEDMWLRCRKTGFSYENYNLILFQGIWFLVLKNFSQTPSKRLSRNVSNHKPINTWQKWVSDNLGRKANLNRSPTVNWLNYYRPLGISLVRGANTKATSIAVIWNGNNCI